MNIHVKSRYFSGEVELQFGKYGNGSIAIKAFDLPGGDPAFTATVAVDEMPSDGCVFLKGWSENEGVPEALEKAGIVEFTGGGACSGFCVADEYKLLITVEEMGL